MRKVITVLKNTPSSRWNLVICLLVVTNQALELPLQLPAAADADVLLVVVAAAEAVEAGVTEVAEEAVAAMAAVVGVTAVAVAEATTCLPEAIPKAEAINDFVRRCAAELQLTTRRSVEFDRRFVPENGG